MIVSLYVAIMGGTYIGVAAITLPFHVAMASGSSTTTKNAPLRSTPQNLCQMNHTKPHTLFSITVVDTFNAACRELLNARFCSLCLALH